MSEYTLLFQGKEITLYGNIVKENIFTVTVHPSTSETWIEKSPDLAQMAEDIKKRISFKVDIQDSSYNVQVSVFRRLLLHKLAEDNIFLGEDGVFYHEETTEDKQVETKFISDKELIMLLLNDGYIIQKKDDRIIVLGKE